MSAAKWLLMVDWNGDERFAGADDDVTSAALGLSLTHMRDLASDHIGAAKLRLQLRNADHKYSPPNSASPLAGKLHPGRKVWLRAAYPCDEFDGIARSSLAQRAPTYGSAYRWTAQKGEFRIAAAGKGATAVGSGAGWRIATLDFGHGDMSIGAYFTKGSNAAHHGGLAFRCADGDNYLYARFTGGAAEIRKTQAGADTLLASEPLAWADNRRRFVQAVLRADSIRVFVDGRQVVEANSDFNKTASAHGLHCDGAANHLWQQFGGWASLFYGSVDVIDPRPNTDDQRCLISASDDMDRLRAVTLYMYASTPMPQTSGAILKDILNYAGVDRALRRLDGGLTLVPGNWSPPLWGARAIDEIHRLQDEEDGFVYIDGRGFWRLENRAHRGNPPHNAARATLQAQNDGRNPYFSRLEWSDGVSNIENKVFVRIRDATNHGYATAWTLGETIRFKAGETREFLAESKDYDIVNGHLAPLPTLDYAANTNADGSGTNITAQLAVTHPSTDTYTGKGTLIRVRFGDTAGYLTRLALRTFSALTFNAPLLVMADDAPSQAAYGQRIRSINARWTRQADIALATAKRRLSRKKTPRTALKATLLNGSDANTLLTLQAEMSDRLSVRYPAMGISADFFVEGHRLEVSEGWSRIERALLLQQA